MFGFTRPLMASRPLPWGPVAAWVNQGPFRTHILRGIRLPSRVCLLMRSCPPDDRCDDLSVQPVVHFPLFAHGSSPLTTCEHYHGHIRESLERSTTPHALGVSSRYCLPRSRSTATMVRWSLDSLYPFVHLLLHRSVHRIASAIDSFPPCPHPFHTSGCPEPFCGTLAQSEPLNLRSCMSEEQTLPCFRWRWPDSLNRFKSRLASVQWEKPSPTE